MEKQEFKIPNYEYDEDIIFEERKKEILDLLVNKNKLKSQKEYKEVEKLLHIACNKCDIGLIKICLSETIEDSVNKMTFKIDETTKTASLFKVSQEIVHLFIPRTVEYEKNEYLITSIIGIGCKDPKFSKIKTIRFDENSAISTFYPCSFEFSNVEEIYFPASLNNLKGGWCCDASQLRKIIISPSNDRFVFKDEKYLLGKSDKNCDEFDVILFANRHIKDISIPSNIKIISSYAFELCDNITKVELPSSVVKIGEHAFAVCRNLTKIEILANSNLEIIERNAFSSTNFEEFFVPPKVTKICQYAFSACRNLTDFEIPPDSNLQIIERGAFAFTNINDIFIPSKVTRICDSTFSYCYNLSKVKFSENSNLQVIEQFAFISSNIYKISIPSSLLEIGFRSFADCHDLLRVQIPANSNLQKIRKYAFSSSIVEEIYFPASLKELEEGWCCNTYKLRKIIISPLNDRFAFKDEKYLLGKSDNNCDEFDIILFANRFIKDISIPSNVSKISEYAFDNCMSLTKVEVEFNSKLQTIGKYAFSSSCIKSFFIPPSVSKICENAFSNCNRFQIIEISESNLQSISPLVFSRCKNVKIMIPQSMRKIISVH